MPRHAGCLPAILLAADKLENGEQITGPGFMFTFMLPFVTLIRTGIPVTNFNGPSVFLCYEYKQVYPCHQYKLSLYEGNNATETSPTKRYQLSWGQG